MVKYGICDIHNVIIKQSVDSQHRPLSQIRWFLEYTVKQVEGKKVKNQKLFHIYVDYIACFQIK